MLGKSRQAGGDGTSKQVWTHLAPTNIYIYMYVCMCICVFRRLTVYAFPQHKPPTPRFAASSPQTVVSLVASLRKLPVLVFFVADVVSAGCVWLSKDGCPSLVDHLTTDRTLNNELASTIVLSRDVLPTVPTTTL